MPSSPRLSAASMETLRSPTKMSPLVGLKSPERRFTSVDFPAPFGPMTAWISPTTSSSDTSLTAARPPKRFDRVAVRSATLAIAASPFGSGSHDEPLKPARERPRARDDDQTLHQPPMRRQS